MNETDEVCNADEPPDKTNHIAFCTVDEENKDQDFFAGIYQRPYMRLSIILTYALAVLSMVGLGFVLWFERSGQAGHYRTLVNQLISFNLDQVPFNVLKLVF